MLDKSLLKSSPHSISAKNHVVSKFLGEEMWENQEPCEFGWIQSFPDQCRHGGNQSPREMQMQKLFGELEEEIKIVILLIKILLNSWFWLRKLKAIYLCKYHGKYFILFYFLRCLGENLWNSKSKVYMLLWDWSGSVYRTGKEISGFVESRVSMCQADSYLILFL